MWQVYFPHNTHMHVCISNYIQNAAFGWCSSVFKKLCGEHHWCLAGSSWGCWLWSQIGGLHEGVSIVRAIHTHAYMIRHSHTSIFWFIRICVHRWMQTHKHVLIHAFWHMSKHACARAYGSVYRQASVCICAGVCLCACASVLQHAYMCICVWCMCAFQCAYVLMLTCVHIHMNMTETCFLTLSGQLCWAMSTNHHIILGTAKKSSHQCVSPLQRDEFQ